MLFGKERVVVYIDGGNTYRKLKELGVPKTGVEYIGFASNPSLGLIKESKPRLFAESDLMPFQIDKPESQG